MRASLRYELRRKSHHLLLAAIGVAVLARLSTVGSEGAGKAVAIMGGVVIAAAEAWLLSRSGRARVSLPWRATERVIGGTTYAALGIVSAVLIGGQAAGVGAVVMLATVDSAAALCGRWIGRTALPYNEQKTVEGLIAGLVAGMLSGVVLCGPTFPAVAVGLAVPLVESACSRRVNDNLACPIAYAVLHRLLAGA